ncbi:MAG: hypothetical protein JW384_02281 [Nitrosomonadaceae bacterium]|nr:hypothetical protein [Nitrosomonadaceae bacterium]
MGVLEVSSSLQSTLQLLDAASNPRVSSRRIRWEAMERVLRVLRTSFKESDANVLAARELECAARAWAWARVCMDGPVDPAHSTTGIRQLRREVDSAALVLGNPRLKALKEAINRVTDLPHPAALILNEMIHAAGAEVKVGERTRQLDVLIVRGEGLVAVQEWLLESGLPADVVTANRARALPPWQGAYIFGPPERYFSSSWLIGKKAANTGGWLLSAPPAPIVHVLSWTGHRPLIKDSYQPWSGAPSSAIKESINVDIIEDEFLPEVSDSFLAVRVPVFNDQESDESVQAYGLQFQTEGVIVLSYFNSEVGPKSIGVTFEDGHAHVTDLPLKSVWLGACLLFRTSVAGRDALDQQTEKWFAERNKSTQHIQALGLQEEFKSAMAAKIREVGVRNVVAELRLQGLEETYVHNLPARVLHKDFIAPQHSTKYLAVCRVVGLQPPANAFQLLTGLRTGRRQAGHVLSSRISERLEQMEDLGEQLREAGSVVLRDPGLEGVVLLVVRDIAAAPAEVPISRLGIVLTSEGHLWHP